MSEFFDGQKYMSAVRVGAKGQIVIPKEVRDMFGIKPGDSMLLMADKDHGIALQRASVLNQIADLIFSGKGKDIYPENTDEMNETFATAIKNVEEDINNGSNKNNRFN